MKLDEFKYITEPCEDDDNEMFSRKQEKSELFRVPVMNGGGFYSLYWKITDGTGKILGGCSGGRPSWSKELIEEQRANEAHCSF